MEIFEPNLKKIEAYIYLDKHKEADTYMLKTCSGYQDPYSIHGHGSGS